MIQRVLCSFGLMLAAALPSVADPDWPELFRKAVSAPERTPARYSYEQVTLDGGGDELYRVAYDPLKPEGSRFRLLFVSEKMKGDHKDLLERIESGGDDVWCEDIADKVKGDVRWKYCEKSNVNSNYALIQHIIQH
jgi:hypothetical protein